MTTSVLNHLNIDITTFIGRAIKKWKPILEIVNIDQNYWKEIALFCESHCEEADDTSFRFPITIKILSKLDLSKVMFTERDICQPVNCSSLSREQICDIQSQTGLDASVMLESSMIEQMSRFLNDKIKEEGGIVIGGLFNISLSSDFNNTIKVSGYILPYNVYRYKKLKKVKGIINGQRSSLC